MQGKGMCVREWMGTKFKAHNSWYQEVPVRGVMFLECVHKKNGYV